jgi:hypothetical protein
MSRESTSLLPHGDGEGRWPTFRFLKGGIPPAYPAWDLSILRTPAMSRISVGTGEDEKEARRCMSPALSTFAKDKSAKVGQLPKSNREFVANMSSL